MQGVAPIDTYACGHPKVGHGADLTAGDAVEDGPWIYSRVVSSGFFHSDKSGGARTDDLVTCWRSGAITLHVSDAKGTFEKTVQLVDPAADKRWKDATSIVAGNFTGSTSNDLFVRWKGGEVSLFKNVTPVRGLKEEIKLALPSGDEAVWKRNVVGLTSGRFKAGKTSDDLVVLWTDGEITRYTVDAKGFHDQDRLHEADDAWRPVAGISAGHFDGTGDTTPNDLMVRWNDGRVSLHEDVPRNGVGKRTDLPGKDPRWADSLVTAGNHDAGKGGRDDLVVRRPDGRLSRYARVTKAGLGVETTLAEPVTLLGERAGLG
ncbi:hypothetical protein [Streptomyces sp. NPDC090025]|uniref:hypothetical protein n=1 Tax=Streptomyces sp. NPDC090025 TaxID=3365922 RepID=UPI0038330FBD